MSVDQGPTTVGSIVGKLKMDRGQWVAMMAATKKDIRDLETADPDIHIDTNAAEVVTKLGAAKAAADAVGASQEELGRKTRRTTEETIKANEANRTSFNRIGAIVTAVALLVPLLAPVGAAAIGVGSAFLGMGAAGVLAIIGIHRAMEDADAVGDAYRRGLGQLDGVLDKLSRTAAVNMLSSFQRVVKETQAALPNLNTQVGQFSTLLGRSGANLFSGAINSLRVLNPLFLTAGVYIEELTAGFQRWTEGSGIEEFGGYALSMLPQVTELLGKLASMVMHILQALAPLGVVGMAVLSGIADVINTIPVEVLSQLIVTITWGAIAFKAWGFIAPMLANIATSMGAVSAATTIATGPIGWVVAGLSALAGIFAVVIAQNSGATSAMQDYTYAVQEDTGAIGENIRAKAAQKLIDEGVIDAAKKLKVSTQDVLEATLGNAEAQKRLNEAVSLGENGSARMRSQLEKTGLDLVDYSLAVTTLTQGIQTNSTAIDGEIGRYNDLQGMLQATTGATRAQQSADEAAAAALGVSLTAYQEAAAGQEEMRGSTEKATAEMYLQNDAAGLLRDTLDMLNGKTLTAAEAQNRFESQLVNLGTALKNGGTELDGMSDAAVSNRGSLLGLIKSSQDAAIALRDQGAGSDEVRQKMIDGRQAIIEQAVANGMNRDAVTNYINELYKIPDKIPATKVETDTANARAQVDQLIRDISSKRAVIVVDQKAGTVVRAGQVGVGANGTTARGLASGGTGGTVVGPGTAGSDTAGLYRLANGEEVISNIHGQADRNRSLLKAINAGFTPAQATAGAVRSAPSTMTASASARATVVQVDVHVSVLKNEDPAVVGNQVGRGVKQALAGVSLK